MHSHHPTPPSRSRTAVVLASLLVLLASCGGGDASDTGETASGADAPAQETGGSAEESAATSLETPQIAFTSPAQPSYVNTRVGPLTYGPEFGLEFTEEDFTVFESHSTATQTTLSGRADIVGGSFVSHALVREAGEDFKVFCPFVSLDDFVLAGRNGVDSIEQLFESETRVAIDSPGGAGAMILNSMLQAADAGTIEDIPSTTVLESSGQRTTAFAADEVDATVIHLTQFNQALAEAPDGVVITSLYEDVPVYIKEAFAAPSQWLEDNRDTAVAFCASILRANQELAGDFDAFAEAVSQYVEEPPEEAELQELFTLIQEYDFWPVDGGMSDDAVTFMMDVAVASGVLTETQEPGDIIARDIIDEAVALAGTG